MPVLQSIDPKPHFRVVPPPPPPIDVQRAYLPDVSWCELRTGDMVWGNLESEFDAALNITSSL